ncbi:BnaC07g13230D [Brassica napus]|uniref:BnaC07g13230D protein n=1 Tax=Brassica napus TaxID=3708 RepID=A0A078FK37_BRANA|nr:BnaC07g13230D [Brassica napus]
MGMDMVTKGVHNVIEFLSDDSPDMDVIGISGDNFFSDINKPAVVNCIEEHGSSLGRFKSYASNIVFDEHSENILPSSEGDVGLAASSGPSVLGDKVDEECAAADPPEIADAQNNRKRCRE